MLLDRYLQTTCMGLLDFMLTALIFCGKHRLLVIIYVRKTCEGKNNFHVLLFNLVLICERFTVTISCIVCPSDRGRTEVS
jgi:hypothetical protein